MEKRTTSPKTKPTPCLPLQRIRRGMKTLFFLAAMVASLLFFSTPLLVAALDMLLPSAVLSAFVAPLSPESLASQLRAYDFRASLVDLPLLSIARSLVIICVYCLFQGPALSRWPYLVITVICSLSSATFVFVKACVAAGMGQWHRAGAAASASAVGLMRREPMASDALFLSSWALAVAHMAVAYRTNCRERRKLVVYRIDLEAVSAYKGAFSNYSKLSN
ncbi:unnamed protein product [Spirodela intermedia]|uniref:Uncharacterized protein n=1 Tax=Spirodela intermedia TaxID=51605 RepID=A0A7I8JB77_SPIIN|nr:unnamed protein product [Spirodela intermedia]CAA6666975.1 unnamed protein product [Spirodela intermedia]